MLLATIYVLLSILLLYFGAEFSLDSTEKLGKRFGFSPLFIGMVLVGFGTSLPEFFVSHIAVIQQKEVMAIGSLVGSNIANMFLILGVSSLVINLKTQGKGVFRYFIIHLLLVPILYFVFQSKKLDGLSSILLIGLSIIYMFYLFSDMKEDQSIYEKEELEGNPWLLFLKTILGFFFLFIGGELLVDGGGTLASAFGVSDYVISAILFAFGTSLPELITSILACAKKMDTDIIVGNIIGSNLFNCALIMGSLGIHNFEFTLSLNMELYVLLAGSLSLLLLNLFKVNLNKFVGSGFLIIYFSMIYYWTQ